MVTVEVRTSDCVIWNQREVYSKLTMAICLGLDLTIDLMCEGPDFRSLGLDQYILEASREYNYDLSKITILTQNMIESYDRIKVEKTFPKHLMEYSLAYDREVVKSNKLDHFGLFIGRSNAPRLFLGSYLYNNYKDQTTHTNNFDRHDDFYCANIGIEELFVRYGIDDICPIADYLTKCPINQKQQKFYQKSNEKNHAQYLLDQDRDKFLKFYENFFVEIVCETYFTGETFFPTEKTWRPILLKTPFIVQGPKNYLKNLRDMGFRTFSDWWSEGYDEDDPGTSWIEITKLVDELSKKSQQELHLMLDQMKDVLDHNRERFFEIYKS